MNSTIIANNEPLVVLADKNVYKVYFNVVPQYEIEKVFKNSAFIETGKKILTGYSDANYLFIKKNIKPSAVDILNNINETIDNYTHNKIISEFIWNGYQVWLSNENQLNYASWLLASYDNPEIFPLCTKFSKPYSSTPVYYNFSTYEELKDFYSKVVKHISNCVDENRKMKENINVDLYKEALTTL